MKRLLFIFSITTSVLALASCTAEPDFSDVPFISDATLTKYASGRDRLGNVNDSLVVSLKFQDGDGDLGVSPTSYPEDDTLSKINNNYEVRTFQRKNGQFQDITGSQTVSNSGNFPRLRTDNKRGPIEGTLTRSITVFRIPQNRNDTLKFMIRIRDRAMNVSNEIETPVVVVNSN